jgi:N-acetylmuramoyl-L-alanine amidase
MRSSGKSFKLAAAILSAALSGSWLGAQSLAVTDTAPSEALATLRALKRDVLPEAVRITMQLDGEVAFDQERLENPSRVIFDLRSTETAPALNDARLNYDTDIVREIQLDRAPNKTTRVVLDMEGVTRYSVYTLYSPYRIVIDCERDKTTAEVLAAHAPVSNPARPDKTAGARERAPAAPVVNRSGKFSVARQLGLGVSKIVIDPGHGGHDPGAKGLGVSEAELVLDVALRLEALLQQRPGFETVLTRRTDDYVTLEERTGIANREEADLFLSIHANASGNAGVRGVETYFLNFALNRQAEAVAARENAGSGRTMASLPGIIRSITLSSKVNESRDFATLVQQSMIRGLRPANGSLKDLGVKQAPFMVLIGATMPSILAEISFVTNRPEARLLKTSAYRQKIAESLLAGIIKYQQALKKMQSASLRQ